MRMTCSPVATSGTARALPCEFELPGFSRDGAVDVHRALLLRCRMVTWIAWITISLWRIDQIQAAPGRARVTPFRDAGRHPTAATASSTLHARGYGATPASAPHLASGSPTKPIPAPPVSGAAPGTLTRARPFHFTAPRAGDVPAAISETCTPQ